MRWIASMTPKTKPAARAHVVHRSAGEYPDHVTAADDPLHHAGADPERLADLQDAHAFGPELAYARASMDGLTERRPSFVPFALARARPALTRSRIMPRSNSAKTPHIWNIARPEGVLVSRAC